MDNEQKGIKQPVILHSSTENNNIKMQSSNNSSNNNLENNIIQSSSNNSTIKSKKSYVAKFRTIFDGEKTMESSNQNINQKQQLKQEEEYIKQSQKFENPAVFKQFQNVKKLKISEHNDIFPDQEHNTVIEEDSQINNDISGIKVSQTSSTNRFGTMKQASSHSQLSSSNSGDKEKEKKINYITHQISKDNKNTSIILSYDKNSPLDTALSNVMGNNATEKSIIINSGLFNKSKMFQNNQSLHQSVIIQNNSRIENNNSNSNNNSQPNSNNSKNSNNSNSLKDNQNNIKNKQQINNQNINTQQQQFLANAQSFQPKQNIEFKQTILIKSDIDQEHKPSQEVRGSIIKWKMGDFIGSGTFGQVFRAMNIQTGQIMAVKKIQLIGTLDNNYLSATEEELNLIKTVSHKNVVKYFGHEKIENSLCIYLEYMDAGNISSIYKKFGALEEENIRIYTRQILSGIHYLHSQNIIHRDIKGANILVDNEGTVKVSDFGCAKQLELTLNSLSENKEDFKKTLKGSVPWMAPEVIKQTNYTYKADIWSFGCTILEMATGQLPWMQYDFDNPISAIIKIGLSDEIPLIPDNVSNNVKDFILQCLNRDPEKRLSAEELLQHSFMKI